MHAPAAGRKGPLLSLTLVIAAAAAALAPVSPVFVERWYSTGVYPHAQRLVTPLSNLVPFAWLDVLSIVAVAWLGRLWWRALRRAGGPRLPRAARAVLATLAAGAAVYLVFLTLWGFNYRREPIARKLVLDARAPTTADVLRLGDAGHEPDPLVRRPLVQRGGRGVPVVGHRERQAVHPARPGRPVVAVDEFNFHPKHPRDQAG